MQQPKNIEKFYGKIVNDYSDTIYRIAFNITKSEYDSYDVCQDVFLRLIKNLHKIKDEIHLKSWILRTAVNCSKSICTQAYRKHTTSLEKAEKEGTSDNIAETSLSAYVLQLPQKYSITIHLYYFEELSIAEIATILEITQSAVKSRLSRGRKKLKTILEKEQYYG